MVIGTGTGTCNCSVNVIEKRIAIVFVNVPVFPVFVAVMLIAIKIN